MKLVQRIIFCNIDIIFRVHDLVKKNHMFMCFTLDENRYIDIFCLNRGGDIFLWPRSLHFDKFLIVKIVNSTLPNSFHNFFAIPLQKGVLTYNHYFPMQAYLLHMLFVIGKIPRNNLSHSSPLPTVTYGVRFHIDSLAIKSTKKRYFEMTSLGGVL